MSQHLESMKIGDTIEFRGPLGRLVYKGPGCFAIKLLRKDPPVDFHMKKVDNSQTIFVTLKRIKKIVVRKQVIYQIHFFQVVMVAGGSGITPMLQLIRAIMKDPADHTQVSILYANQSEKDILLREELDEAVQLSGGQIKVWYTVDTSNEGWKYSTGYINADMIKDHMHPPSAETMVLMCGPPPMINFACIPNLDKLGYDPKLRFSY